MLGTQDVPQVYPCILRHLGNIFHQNKQQPVVHLQPIHSRTFTSKFSLHHTYECHLLFKTLPQPCLYFNYVSLRYVNEKDCLCKPLRYFYWSIWFLSLYQSSFRSLLISTWYYDAESRQGLQATGFALQAKRSLQCVAEWWIRTSSVNEKNWSCI